MFAYAALDGFDIGVGCLHLFARSDLERRIFINAIGPVWDSNSLWVVITGGALFAGFPQAFASLLSTLYIPVMLLIFCYTYRACAIEFRSKIYSPKWRAFWDAVFFVASLGLAFGLGLFLANLIRGLPINAEGECEKALCSLFSSYATIVGFFAVILFMLHGALYLKLKTDGELQARLSGWVNRLTVLFLIFYIALHAITLYYEPQVTERVERVPLVLLPGIIGCVSLLYSIRKGYDGWAFISSSMIILSLVLLFVLGTYPNILRSTIAPEHSLTIFNASSSPFTLKILLGMAALGAPLFLLYMSYTYKVFKGKVELNTMSY